MSPTIKRGRIFYGWWVVGACFFISLYMGGVVIYAFTAIFEPIVSEFGWSYTQISLAASLRGLEMGLLAPLMGILVDRFGPRYLMLGGTFLVGLGLIFFSRVSNLGMFYVAFVLIATGMSALAPTVTTTAVANWFRKKVGIATGIMVSGFGLSGLMIPVVVWLIASYEWRMTMVILGVGMWLIGLPLSLLVRHRPEQYGYLPDGEANTMPDTTISFAGGRGKLKVREVLKNSAFWHVALAFMCQIMIAMAVVTHVMPYLGSLGISRSLASLIATCVPLISIGGRIGFGWLGDRFDKRWVAASGLASMSLGLLFFSYLTGDAIWLVVPFIILFGIGYGSIHTMRAALTRELFSRESYGTVFGLMTTVMMVGNVSGSPLAGWVFDRWGSYQGIWLIFALVALLALISVATTPKHFSKGGSKWQ